MKRALILLCIAGCAQAAAESPSRMFELKRPAKSAAAVMPRQEPIADIEPPAMASVAVKMRDEPLDPPAPSLSLPESVAGDVGAFISVKATTNGSDVRWVALDKGLNVFPAEQLRDSRGTVVTSSAAGNYRLLAYTALGGVPSDPRICMVVVNGAQPPPEPPVPPKPPDPPKPPVVVPQNLWIVTVDDWGARTPTVAAMMSNVTLWQGFTAQGHQFRQLNKTDPAVAAKFSEQIKLNGGIPIVVLMTQDGTWLNKDPADMKFPATTEGMAALVRKYAGK